MKFTGLCVECRRQLFPGQVAVYQVNESREWLFHCYPSCDTSSSSGVSSGARAAGSSASQRRPAAVDSDEDRRATDEDDGNSEDGEDSGEAAEEPSDGDGDSDEDDEGRDAEDGFAGRDIPQRKLLFCSMCERHFNADDFSAKQLREAPADRFCLRHTGTSAFGASYRRPAQQPTGLRLLPSSPYPPASAARRAEPATTATRSREKRRAATSDGDRGDSDRSSDAELGAVARSRRAKRRLPRDTVRTRPLSPPAATRRRSSRTAARDRPRRRVVGSDVDDDAEFDAGRSVVRARNAATSAAPPKRLRELLADDDASGGGSAARGPPPRRIQLDDEDTGSGRAAAMAPTPPLVEARGDGGEDDEVVDVTALYRKAIVAVDLTQDD
eukprot:gene9666-6916_t